MSSDFTLEPYVGAMPVTFDMTTTEVERILGPPEDIDVNDLGEREEHRGWMDVRYSNNDGMVCELGFGRRATLLFHGKNLLDDNTLLQFLMQFDPQPFEWVGFLIFLELGITVGGFHDHDESQKAITVFRRGRWDDFSGEFTVYSKSEGHKKGSAE